MNNIWEKLSRPFIALAPMAGITDMPFRQICTDFGADLAYSEMASTAALQFQPKKTLEMLRSSKDEAPLIIQIFGSDPAQFANAAKILSSDITARSLDVENYHRPAGIDINFGCPVSKVVKTGSGAMLFQDLVRSREVIQATLDNTDLPISIKIRRQAGKIKADQFLETMSDLPISAVMIHGRSLGNGFAGPADFSGIQELRQIFSGRIIANGGITDRAGAKDALEISKADGLGLARGVLGKPWLFRMLKDPDFSADNKLIFDTIIKHAELIRKDNDYFKEFRKHLCWYVSGLDGATRMRLEAVKIANFDDVVAFVDKFNI